MQLVGHGKVVERDMRTRGRLLFGGRRGDQFVEQRREVAARLGAHDSLLYPATRELPFNDTLAAER